MRNFLDKNFNEVSGPASVGVTVNNGNFPHLQTAKTRSHMVPYPITRMFIIVDNISAGPGSWLPIIQSTHNHGLPRSLIRILRARTADCTVHSPQCLKCCPGLGKLSGASLFTRHSDYIPDTQTLFSKSRLSAEITGQLSLRPGLPRSEHYAGLGWSLGCIYKQFIFTPTHWLVSCSGRQLYCNRERSAWLLWMCSSWSLSSSDHKVCPSC